MPGFRKFAGRDQVQVAGSARIGKVVQCHWYDGFWWYRVEIAGELLRIHERDLTLADPVTMLGDLARTSGDL